MASDKERLATVEAIIPAMQERQSEIYDDVKSILKHVAVAEEKEAQRLRENKKTVIKAVVGGSGGGGVVAGIIEAVNRLF